MSAKPDGDRGVDLAVTALVKNFECRSKKAPSSEEIAQIGTVASNGDLSIGRRSPMR